MYKVYGNHPWITYELWVRSVDVNQQLLHPHFRASRVYLTKWKVEKKFRQNSWILFNSHHFAFIPEAWEFWENICRHGTYRNFSVHFAKPPINSTDDFGKSSWWSGWQGK
jgi:hypothetical protein